MGRGEDEYGNYYDSPAGQSHIKNSRTSADTEAAREAHEWCVKRMRAMKKAKAVKSNKHIEPTQ